MLTIIYLRSTTSSNPVNGTLDIVKCIGLTEPSIKSWIPNWCTNFRMRSWSPSWSAAAARQLFSGRTAITAAPAEHSARATAIAGPITGHAPVYPNRAVPSATDDIIDSATTSTSAAVCLKWRIACCHTGRMQCQRFPIPHDKIEQFCSSDFRSLSTNSDRKSEQKCQGRVCRLPTYVCKSGCQLYG